ncbi:VacJ family lipoprotein [Pseudodesulfovibrio sp.]|uniref:MlaA family lipoprotein n=1 Tax=Pseudodesulfovibrio sp. TaxID=2035812 RepID=UPI0026389D0D|nr:VacJ family lipoprotein [Pseudodesulfovibrio sp.]MDD3312837.1 VacJ family lipoprotein [Pseudodesulfovibrio sp.]
MTARRLPILTALWAVLLLALAGCGPSVLRQVDPALTLAPSGFRTEANHWPDTCGSSGFAVMDVYDPWEPLNRNIYSFNAAFDDYFMLPATDVYTTVVPSPARTGVKNVIRNLNEVGVLTNCLLQGKMRKSAITTGRFLINSTFGLGGLFDLASNNPKLRRQEEDFGQTLGVWGVGNGPYFVMPFFGPSNLRDTVGFGGDFMLLWWEMKTVYKTLGINDNWNWTLGELAIRALNMRANIPFRYHKTGSPFEYELVRFVYTKKRELDIRK